MNFGTGPTPAKIMLVGEAYGQEEDARKEPFVGLSGQELNRMLHEAGIMRSEVYCTNVVNARPKNNDLAQWIAFKRKDETMGHYSFRGKMVTQIVVDGWNQLRKEIELVQPNVIAAAGNLALWALTDKSGVLKWRGSTLKMDGLDAAPTVIPIIHPAAIMREWSWRAATVSDLKRVKAASHSRVVTKPEWRFIIRPSYDSVNSCLSELIKRCDQASEGVWIDFDLETRAGHITTAGLSWSLTEAISIPFMLREDDHGYWIPEVEANVVHLLYRLLTHPKCWVRGQNLLYDAQYTYRHWHFVPNVKQDTMISMHALFSDLKKSLDFQASLFCDYYVQWKPEKGVWKAGA